MKKVNLITGLCILGATFIFPNQAQARVLFLDSFNINPATSGWNTKGVVESRDHNVHPSIAPSGKPVALIKAVGQSRSFMTRTISTLNYEDITFSYYRHTHNLGGRQGDRFLVRWKVSTDSNWNLLERFRGNEDWAFRSWSLPPEANNTSIDIGFFVRNVKGKRGRGFVDDVKLEGNFIPEPPTLVLLSLGLLGAAVFKRKVRP